MSQKAIAGWLKGLIIGAFLCVVIIYALVVPTFGQSIARAAPEFAYCYVPWLIFISVTALPCIFALFLAWKIAVKIGQDRAFTLQNAKWMKYIAFFIAGDGFYFFVGNVIFLLLGMSHPGVALLSLVIVIACIAISIAAAALSFFIKKAAALQEQSDWTI